MKSDTTRGRLTRHGMLLTAILLGVSLLLVTWDWRRSAEVLSYTISEGHGETLLQGLRERSPPWLGLPTDEALRDVFAAHEASGLRGIALIERDGSLRVVVGDVNAAPLSPDEIDGKRSISLHRVGNRFRIIAPPPPHPPRRRPTEGPPPELMPPPHPAERAKGPIILMEFEPLLATGLVVRARRASAVAALAAVVLIAAATLLWRRAAREEALAARLGQSERLASLGSMSAVLAHEIKNPLASLKGNAQLLAEGLHEGSKPKAQADRVVEAAVRLQGLVGDLLDFVRQGSIERVPADPAELLCMAALDTAPEAKLDLDAAPARWHLDPLRMRQVLENLLRNAAQAASGGEVLASVREESEGLVFVVRDSGPGLPPGSPEVLFEPFFTTKIRGVGLGLTVARRIVELHGGVIAARTRSEGGAELRVMIPRPASDVRA